MKTYKDTYSEMLVNYGALKQCKKIYNIISIFYALFCIVYACESFNALMSPDMPLIPLLLDGIIFKAAILVFGYGSCYKHKSIFSVFTIILSLCSIIMAAFDSGSILITGFPALYFLLLFLCIFAGVVIIFTNKKYNYLEEQPGFPYFNERYEEQKFNSVQANIKSEFQQNYEKHMKTSSEKMEELNTAPPVSNNPGYGKMDDI